MTNAGFWWTWGFAIAIASSVLMQPVAILILLVFVAVQSRILAESKIEWRRFQWMVRAAIWLAAFRFLLQLILGTPMGVSVLFELPTIQLPTWLAGLRLGGKVTQLSLEFGLMQALRLSALIVIFAGVSVIASPRTLLETSTGPISNLRLFASITLNFIPQIAADAERLNRANRWRGQNSNRITQLRRNLIPLTETALERSINLGAALSLRTGLNPIKKSTWLKKRDYLAALVVITFWLFTRDPIASGILLLAWVIFRIDSGKISALIQQLRSATNRGALVVILISALQIVAIQKLPIYQVRTPSFSFWQIGFELLLVTPFLLLALYQGLRHVRNS